jgi:hypothetical protein
VLAHYTLPLEWRSSMQVLARDLDVPQVDLMALLPGIASYDELMQTYSLGWDTHLDATAHAHWGKGVAELVVRRGILAAR